MRDLGLDDMAVAMPPARSISDVIAEAGRGHDVVDTARANGLARVPVATTGTVVDLALDALTPILEREPDLHERVDLVLLAHSAPILAPADEPLLAELVDRAGLSHAAAFAVTGQPCAILHSVVDWALHSEFVEDDDPALLVIGADRANHPAERVYFGTIMGDAAVAMLLGRRSSRRRILAQHVHTELHASEGEWSPADAITTFRERNPLLIRSAIERCVANAGHALGDVAAVIPHTPNLAIWDLMADVLRYPRSRILTQWITETGHLSSNDSFVHFHRAEEEGVVASGDLVLLVNQGFGGTQGCTLIHV